jgi:hypothetical protein
MFPEEERHLFTHRKVGRRLRWFQSDNVRLLRELSKGGTFRRQPGSGMTAIEGNP